MIDSLPDRKLREEFDRWAEAGTMHGGDATAITGAAWAAAPSAGITIAGE